MHDNPFDKSEQAISVGISHPYFWLVLIPISFIQSGRWKILKHFYLCMTEFKNILAKGRWCRCMVAILSQFPIFVSTMDFAFQLCHCVFHQSILPTKAPNSNWAASIMYPHDKYGVFYTGWTSSTREKYKEHLFLVRSFLSQYTTHA